MSRLWLWALLGGVWPLCHAYDVTPIEVLVSQALEAKMFEFTKMLGQGVLVKLDRNHNDTLVLVKHQGKNVLSKFLYNEAQGLRRYTNPQELLAQSLALKEKYQSNSTTPTTVKPEAHVEQPLVSSGHANAKEKLEWLWERENPGIVQGDATTPRPSFENAAQLLERRRPYVPLRRVIESGGYFPPRNRHSRSVSDRDSRDLIYERMKMRTGNFKSQTHDMDEPVGGGILEKRLFNMGEATDLLNSTELDQDLAESRENGRPSSPAAAAMMQLLMSMKSETRGGVLECHPYAMGRYRKIGSCGGRSFYQHNNNTDIFLYYACGAWYVGMEVGSCGGWILAKSVELCSTAEHQDPWKFYNNGQLEHDPSFHAMELCQFYDDFRPLPSPQTPITQGFPVQHQFPNSFGQINQPQPSNNDRHDMYQPNDSWQKLSEKLKQETIKHEHYHYHVDVKDDEAGQKGYKPIVNGYHNQQQSQTSWTNNQRYQSSKPTSSNPMPPPRVPSAGLDMNSMLNLQNNQLLNDFIKKQELYQQGQSSPKPNSFSPSGQASTPISINGEEIQSPNQQSIMINNFHVPTQGPSKTSARPYLVEPMNAYNPPSTTPLRPSSATDSHTQMVSYIVKKKKAPMEVKISSDAILLSHHGRDQENLKQSNGYQRPSNPVYTRIGYQGRSRDSDIEDASSSESDPISES
ncbi:uncharacterized protein LOC131878727 isoform X2 [Tigriopus californicus]|uniref:uncharacterized protein LOC131878727 isoform X2 n=1 Tax=Tigriopus californicus TaxID=6832 RepID=UPI0027DA5A1A|nr:uncharacterized protein LOC131878727 isoform X2 [Tigriopus californicus]